MRRKKCPFGFQSRSNVNLESDLPSWHPKLVSYDVEGVNNLEVGPPMLKKTRLGKIDDIIVYRGHFYVKGKVEQKRRNRHNWSRTRTSSRGTERRGKRTRCSKRKRAKRRKKKDVGERIADRFFPPRRDFEFVRESGRDE